VDFISVQNSAPAQNPLPPPACHLERSEAQSKDLRLLLARHAIGCTFQVRGFRVVPVAAQVHPRRIRSLDQRDLLFASPSLQLLFACDGVSDLSMGLEPDEPIAVVGSVTGRSGTLQQWDSFDSEIKRKILAPIRDIAIRRVK
jgi:hypothetical protein